MAHRPYMRCPTCATIIEFLPLAVAGKHLGDCRCEGATWVLAGGAAFLASAEPTGATVAITTTETPA